MPVRPADHDVYFRFFPNDWRSDEQLQVCSLAARGLWIELLCLAHKAGGYVKVNGMSATTVVIARQVRADPLEVRRLLKELINTGVCTVLADGTICSRRMVRDAKRRDIYRKNGSRGGNPLLISGRKTRKTANGITNLLKTHSHSHSHSHKDQDPPLPPLGGTAENYEQTKLKHAKAMTRERQRRHGKP